MKAAIPAEPHDEALRKSFPLFSKAVQEISRSVSQWAMLQISFLFFFFFNVKAGTKKQ